MISFILKLLGYLLFLALLIVMEKSKNKRIKEVIEYFIIYVFIFSLIVVGLSIVGA